MERWVSKLIAFFLIFTLMTIAGLLPIKVSDWYNKKGEKGQFYISILNCFGGGVFFGTYLMHMAPEVRLILEESLMTPKNLTYPFPELAIGFGFFLLLFVDKIVTIIAHQGAKATVEPEKIQPMVEPTVFKHKHGYRADGHLSNSRAASPRLVTRTHHDSVSSYVTRPHADSFSSQVGSAIAHPSHANGTAVPIESKTKNGSAAHATNGSAIGLQTISNGYVDEAMQKDRGLSIITVDDHKYTIEDDQHLSTEDAELAARPYIFLVALSIDCIFEGMSLGLQDDSYGVWMLVIAILSHELVITFSFGLRLVKLFSTKKVVFLIVFYASTIPIGIIIGFIIFETGGGSNKIDIVSGFFQAIAAGIFIYITFLEILNEELIHDTYFSKPLAVLFGFLFMASMVLVDNIDSSGGSGDGSGEVNTTANAYVQNMLQFIDS